MKPQQWVYRMVTIKSPLDHTVRLKTVMRHGVGTCLILTLQPAGDSDEIEYPCDQDMRTAIKQAMKLAKQADKDDGFLGSDDNEPYDIRRTI